MPVGRFRMPVGLLAMFLRGGGMVLGLVMLTNRMVVGRLMVVMGRSTVMSGGIVVVLARWMLVLVGHNHSPGCRLGWARAMLEVDMDHRSPLPNTRKTCAIDSIDASSKRSTAVIGARQSTVACRRLF
jgi:hypothetical protein